LLVVLTGGNVNDATLFEQVLAGVEFRRPGPGCPWWNARTATPRCGATGTGGSRLSRGRGTGLLVAGSGVRRPLAKRMMAAVDTG